MMGCTLYFIFPSKKEYFGPGSQARGCGVLSATLRRLSKLRCCLYFLEVFYSVFSQANGNAALPVLFHFFCVAEANSRFLWTIIWEHIKLDLCIFTLFLMETDN